MMNPRSASHASVPSPAVGADKPASVRRGRKAGPVPAAAKARNRRVLHAHSNGASTWPEFVERFEQFTDVLCSAAKYGCEEHFETEYVTLRCWFMAHYYRHAPLLRPRLDAAADSSSSHLPTVVEITTGAKRRMDRFESIFLPRSLKEVLAHDDGNLISLVSHVSHAVYEVDA